MKKNTMNANPAIAPATPNPPVPKNPNFDHMMDKLERSTTMDRRQITVELSDMINSLVGCKVKFNKNQLSKTEGTEIMDMMIAGLSKINVFVNKYDNIRFH
nr:MAG TPA_asm: hypothetical protein [Caudoviricetes sp.]